MPDQEARGGTLIAGGGFAGAYVARLLGDRGSTIVSADNFMLFTPMLPEAASGTLEPRHVVVPSRQMCPHADLILGQVTAHDPERRGIQVVTEDRVFWIRYTDLVVALGSVVRTLPIPGLAEHALGFKSLGEAIHLRNHVLQRLPRAERARRGSEPPPGGRPPPEPPPAAARGRGRRRDGSRSPPGAHLRLRRSGVRRRRSACRA